MTKTSIEYTFHPEHWKKNDLVIEIAGKILKHH